MDSIFLFMDLFYSFEGNLDDLKKEIPQLWDSIAVHRIILLQGEMGAGKTTLVQLLANYLGTDDRVQSPSYALMNEYFINNEDDLYPTWVHSDWFRINDISEAIDMGFQEMLEDINLRHFIEWSEKINEIVPKDAILIKIEKITKASRKITLSYLM